MKFFIFVGDIWKPAVTYFCRAIVTRLKTGANLMNTFYLQVSDIG